MKASFALAVIGSALALGQLVWPLRTGPSPWSMLPLLLAVPTLASGFLLGAVRGSPLYRRAVAIGAVGIVTIVYGFGYMSRGRPGVPPPDLSMNEILLVAGLAMAGVALVVGAVALRRDPIQAAPPGG